MDKSMIKRLIKFFIGQWFRSGTNVEIPVQALHTCEEYWGENAKKFDVQRWIDDPNLYPYILTCILISTMGKSSKWLGLRMQQQSYTFTIVAILEF